MAEYSIYPFEYMRITQRHDEGNHLPHWYPTANCSDKPWDEAVKDGNRQYFDPSNEYRIVEILGLGTTTTNSVRLESVEKLKIPYQEEPVILEVTLTHMEEETIKQLNSDSYKRLLFTLPNTIADTTAAKAWLETNPIEFYYSKNNTTEENVTLPNILLNKGTNIVSVGTNLTPSNMWIKYKGKE